MRIKNLLILLLFITFSQLSAQNAREYTTYIVKDGESLRSIARKIGCRYKEIKNLNPDVDKKHPRVNTTLVIPNKDFGKPIKVVRKKPKTKVKIHVVEKGNTIFSIAKKYNVTVHSLIEANPYAKKGIKPGQKLRIPSVNEFTLQPKNTKVVFYKVQKGDTKWRIATIYQISVKELDKLNPKHVGELKENENIWVPAQKSVSEEIKETYKQERDSLFVYHIVKQGEGLFRIAVMYSTTQEEIIKLNPEATKKLRPGMLLKIPAKKKDDFLMHQVLKGDNFFNLSKKYNTTKEELIKLNPELKNGVKLGMFIKVAVTSNTDYNANIIHKEDTYDTDYMIDSISNQSIHISFLMPLMLKKGNDITSNEKRLQNICTDFYMGAEIAIDSLKKQGIDLTYHIYDTKNDPTQLYHLLQNDDIKNSKALIGPFFINNANKIADELPKIPVFTPSRKKSFSNKPNLIKSAIDTKELDYTLISYLKNKYQKQKIIIIADTNIVNIRKALTIKNNLLQHDSIKSISIIKPSRNRRNNEQVYMDKEKLQKSIDEKNENWIILVSDMKVISSDIVNTYGVMANDFKVKLFTTKSFDNYNYLDYQLLGELSWSFPSIEFTQLCTDEVTYFNNTYQEKNFSKPTDYSFTGFDMTYDTVMRLLRSNDFSEGLNAGKSKRLSRLFDYKNIEGLYINKGAMMIRFDENLDFNILD
jgi:LysM repeat protein